MSVDALHTGLSLRVFWDHVQTCWILIGRLIQCVWTTTQRGTVNQELKLSTTNFVLSWLGCSGNSSVPSFIGSGLTLQLYWFIAVKSHPPPKIAPPLLKVSGKKSWTRLMCYRTTLRFDMFHSFMVCTQHTFPRWNEKVS